MPLPWIAGARLALGSRPAGFALTLVPLTEPVRAAVQAAHRWKQNNTSRHVRKAQRVMSSVVKVAQYVSREGRDVVRRGTGDRYMWECSVPRRYQRGFRVIFKFYVIHVYRRDGQTNLFN